MVALLALTFAPFARVFGLLRPASCAVQVLHMVHELVVVLCRSPRAVLPLAFGLRVFPDGIFIM